MSIKTIRDAKAVPAIDFDFKKLVIYHPELTRTDDGTFFKSKVGYVYPDGTVGPAVFSLSEKRCYGVRADNVDKDGNVVIDETGKEKPRKGYRAPLVMSSECEYDYIDDVEVLEALFFEHLQTHIQDWAFENRAKFCKITAKRPVIDAMVPFALVDEGSSKVFYCPLQYSVNDTRYNTVFYDVNDNQIDPLSVKGHCLMVPTIQIEGLFMDSKTISPILKIYDAIVTPVKLRCVNASVVTEDDDEDDETEDDETEDDDEVEETKPKAALIAANADVNAVTDKKWTPLHYASYNGHAAVVKALIAANADVNAVTDKKWTPLHCASCNGHAAVVTALIAANANVNAVTDKKWTPLHYASCKGHTAVVTALIAAKALL